MPIPGTRSISRLGENAAATKLVMTAQELERIERVLTSTAVAGTRYMQEGMALVNGESAARNPA